MAKYQQPPIDWLKALVLERLEAQNLDLKKLAALTGYEYSYTRKMNVVPSSDWKQAYKKAVCAALGIEIAALPTDVQMAIAQY